MDASGMTGVSEDRFQELAVEQKKKVRDLNKRTHN
jgi:hypothetical protein